MPTGFGGGGLASVTTDSTLTGAGTSSSHLGVKGWPLTTHPCSRAAVAITLGGANQVYITGFSLGYELTFSNIATYGDAGDGVGFYDLGVYTKAGALVANIGATHLPSGTPQHQAILQAPLTLAPGDYAFAFTGNAVVATIRADNQWATWIDNSNVATSSAGVLPASIGALTPTPGITAFYFVLY